MTDPKETDPLSYQVGGDHYKDLEYQPIQFFEDLHLDAFQANVIKYLARWRKKGGVEDLKKALHYVQVAKTNDAKRNEKIERFVKQFENPEREIMRHVIFQLWNLSDSKLTHWILVCTDGQTHWEGENQEKRKAEAPNADANIFEENETRKQ